MIPDGRRDGQEIGARRDQGGAVFGRDAADRNAGHDHHLVPPDEDLRVRQRRLGQGGRGEEDAEGDIVRALLGGRHGGVARAAAGHADNRLAAQGVARVADRARVRQMDPVEARGARGRRVLVDHQRHAARVADRAQNLGGGDPRRARRLGQTKLDAGDIARIQRGGERLGEGGRLDARRRDEVEPAAFRSAAAGGHIPRPRERPQAASSSIAGV